MKRLVPHPILSCALVLMWMILTSFSLGQLILGTAISLLAGRALALIEPNGPPLKRPWRAIPLFWVVSWDILVSNYQVARRIIRGPRPDAPSGFVRVKLRIRGEIPLALLGLILCATPGSAWIAYDSERNELLIHVLELDGTDWATLIRDRYEAPLMEIFA